MNTLVFLLSQGAVVAWRLEPKKAPIRCKIQAETCFKVDSPAALAEAFRDVLARLRGDGITPSHVHWLFDDASRALWAEAAPQLLSGGYVAQGLAWAWLAERFALSAAPDLTDVALIESRLLPWFLSLEKDSEHLQAALLQEHQSESARLEEERNRLQKENEQLRAEKAEIESGNIEGLLLNFLPALFSPLLTMLSSTDMTLLSSCTKPFNVSNDCLESSEKNLLSLQHQFRALPHAVQREILNFVQDHPLYPTSSLRPEMRAHIAQLEN